MSGGDDSAPTSNSPDPSRTPTDSSSIQQLRDPTNPQLLRWDLNLTTDMNPRRRPSPGKTPSTRRASRRVLHDPPKVSVPLQTNSRQRPSLLLCRATPGSSTDDSWVAMGERGNPSHDFIVRQGRSDFPGGGPRESRGYQLRAVCNVHDFQGSTTQISPRLRLSESEARFWWRRGLGKPGPA